MDFSASLPTRHITINPKYKSPSIPPLALALLTLVDFVVADGTSHLSISSSVSHPIRPIRLSINRSLLTLSFSCFETFFLSFFSLLRDGHVPVRGSLFSFFCPLCCCFSFLSYALRRGRVRWCGGHHSPGHPGRMCSSLRLQSESWLCSWTAGSFSMRFPWGWWTDRQPLVASSCMYKTHWISGWGTEEIKKFPTASLTGCFKNSLGICFSFSFFGTPLFCWCFVFFPPLLLFWEIWFTFSVPKLFCLFDFWLLIFCRFVALISSSPLLRRRRHRWRFSQSFQIVVLT